MGEKTEKDYKEMTLGELLKHTERVVHLMAKTIEEELERLNGHKKDK